MFPIRPNEGLAEFIEFPWSVYAGDPLWIPPCGDSLCMSFPGPVPSRGMGGCNCSLEVEEFAEVFAGVLTLMTRQNLSILVQNNRDMGCAFVFPDYGAEVRMPGGHAAGGGALARR